MIASRRAEARGGGDRGVALVEMAIVAPLLALLVAGMVEFGTMWRDNLTMSSSTRASARIVSNLADERLADYEALLTLEAGLTGVDGINLHGVLIYDAGAADGQPHASCFDGTGDPQASAGHCNFYSAADVAMMPGLSCAVTCAEFPNNANCAGGLTVYFCPQEDRETDQALGTANVGIWIRADRPYITGLLPGNGVTMTDSTVMKVEPR
jgi:hypothetical protein